MNIRIEGTKTEILEFIAKFKFNFDFETNARFYKNRGTTEKGRLYLNNVKENIIELPFD